MSTVRTATVDNQRREDVESVTEQAAVMNLAARPVHVWSGTEWIREPRRDNRAQKRANPNPLHEGFISPQGGRGLSRAIDLLPQVGDHSTAAIEPTHPGQFEDNSDWETVSACSDAPEDTSDWETVSACSDAETDDVQPIQQEDAGTQTGKFVATPCLVLYYFEERVGNAGCTGNPRLVPLRTRNAMERLRIYLTLHPDLYVGYMMCIVPTNDFWDAHRSDVESLGREFVEERQTISLSRYIREMDERRARTGPASMVGFRALTPPWCPIVTRRSVVTFNRRVGGDTPIADDVHGVWEDPIMVSHPGAPPAPNY